MNPDRSSSPASSTPSPERLVRHLCKLLTVTPQADGSYLGMAIPGGRGRVFGGQVIGQALMAAGATVAGRQPNSLHAYFLRPGDNARPITFQVERDLDGGTFSNRRVSAVQDGRPILTMSVSFHAGDRGFRHSAPMPALPGPYEAPSEADWALAHRDQLPEPLLRRILRPRPIEVRRLERAVPGDSTGTPARHALWLRTVAGLGDAPQLLHRAILAFASDMGLMSTALRPHAVDWSTPGLQGASIDHALWFHNDARVDDWLLYAMDSPWADHGRGMNGGQIFSADGTLVASVAQEGLNRLRDEPPPPSGQPSLP